MKKFILLLGMVLLLGGCGIKSASKLPSEKTTLNNYTTQIFAMDTVMDISIYSDNDAILSDASQLITRLERTLSTTHEESEIYQLNHTRKAHLSEETSSLMRSAMNFCAKTDGALDLSIYPIVKAWGFTTDTYRVPAAEEISSLLKYVDYTQIQYSAENDSATLPEGMEIDLGSIAKGFTGDRLIELFRKHGISSALLNLGGNVQALGSKPDGAPWRIAIQDPADKANQLGVLSITDKAVITSGGYERYFKDDAGNIYWHIIDPATGYPAKNGLISATAVGQEGVYCDALSTSLFIMGPDKAVDFWRNNRDFDMILVTDTGKLIITPGIADSFQPVNPSPYTLEVLTNVQN